MISANGDLIVSCAVLATLAVLRSATAAGAFPTCPSEVVIPWLDQPAENPVPQIIQGQLVWEDLDSWITPNEEFP